MIDVTQHKWAMVIAHPGHELRALHFVEQVKPLVNVLTDGSGSHGASRIHETGRLLAELGAAFGPLRGGLTDRLAYERLVAVDHGTFTEMAAVLGAAFREHRITAVVSDAAEEYNPIHDICRAVSEAAVEQCGGSALALFELDLIGHPLGPGHGLRMHLDDEAFARKLDAVGRYAPLADEASTAFELHGLDAFRTEFFRSAVTMRVAPPTHVPYYERVGDERVRQGRYSTVLRYGQHVRPVLMALLAASRENRDAIAVDPLH